MSTSSGEFQISWTLVAAHGGGATCLDLAVDHVVATITDKTTNNSMSATAPCGDGTVTTDPLPLGTYDVKLEAFGPAGDRATAYPNETHGTLNNAGATVTLPPLTLSILDATTSLRSTWSLTYKGAPSSCAELAPNGVAIVTTPDGQAPQRDIWDCEEPNAVIELPVGKFASYAQLLGPGDAVISTSPIAKVDATRGEVDLMFRLDWP